LADIGLLVALPDDGFFAVAGLATAFFAAGCFFAACAGAAFLAGACAAEVDLAAFLTAAGWPAVDFRAGALLVVFFVAGLPGAAFFGAAFLATGFLATVLAAGLVVFLAALAAFLTGFFATTSS
jgi:hypothetical protein